MKVQERRVYSDMHAHARNHDVEGLMKCYEKGLPIDEECAHGLTPLAYALTILEYRFEVPARPGLVETVKFLVAHGASLNSRGYSGRMIRDEVMFGDTKRWLLGLENRRDELRAKFDAQRLSKSFLGWGV